MRTRDYIIGYAIWILIGTVSAATWCHSTDRQVKVGHLATSALVGPLVPAIIVLNTVIESMDKCVLNCQQSK